MKKVLSALLATVVTVSLTGCDTKSRNESPQPMSKPFLSASESSYNSLPQAEESSVMDKSPDEPASSVSESNPSPLAAIIRPEVKEAIDSYEEFIDEYCKFMKEYTSSSNPMLMMSEYLDYMQRLSDMSEKFDKIDNSDWTTAETAYYTEVMLRCQNKLLDVI